MKTLTLQQAEDSKGSSLYAINKTAKRGQAAGVINISVAESNGRMQNVNMPVTDIPIDLSTQATKTAIINAPNFRRLVTMGVVEIVDSNDAEELFMRDEEARQELNEVLGIISRVGTVGGTGGTGETAKAAVAEEQAAAGNVSPVAISIANADTDEAKVLRQLRNNKTALSNEDLQHIAQAGKLASVKAEAAKLIVG